MAIVLTFNPTIEKIVEVVEKMSDEEQKILLAQLNAQYLLKTGTTNVTKKSAKVSMAQIDKWKHESRNYAK